MKKLKLKKETIALLDNNARRSIYGGDQSGNVSCSPTCKRSCNQSCQEACASILINMTCPQM